MGTEIENTNCESAVPPWARRHYTSSGHHSTPGTCILFLSAFAEANVGQADPGVCNVAGRAPEIAANFDAPGPDVAVAVLTETVHDVAINFIQRRAHHVIRLFQFRQTAIFGDLRIRAPVILQIIEAP